MILFFFFGSSVTGITAGTSWTTSSAPSIASNYSFEETNLNGFDQSYLFLLRIPFDSKINKYYKLSQYYFTFICQSYSSFHLFKVLIIFASFRVLPRRQFSIIVIISTLCGKHKNKEICLSALTVSRVVPINLISLPWHIIKLIPIPKEQSQLPQFLKSKTLIKYNWSTAHLFCI